METKYILCNCYELENTYNHTVTFNSENSQYNYFLSKAIAIVDENSYQRKNETEIRIDKNLDELKNVNYIVAINKNCKYYYFILEKNYINDYTTEVILELDVIQTYFFDITFTECLIERQHITNWFNGLPNFTFSDEEEELETGEYVVKNIYNVYDYTKKGSYIITSTDVLGKISENDTTAEGVEQGTSTSENYLSYNVDENGLVMIKHFEGLITYEYQDIYGNWTTGYGFTNLYQPNAYSSFIANPTEENGAIILSNLINSQFGITVTNAIQELVDNEILSENWLTQNKFNALVSYCYQNGNINSIISKLESGYTDAELFNWWYNLTEFDARRKFEANVFYQNVYGDMSISVNYGDSTIDIGYIPEQNQ